MAWLAVDEDGMEYMYEVEPIRCGCAWGCGGNYINLPSGSIEKLIGRKLNWEDEPVEIS